MADRVIFHVDVNSAFLSWEAVEHLKNGGAEDYRTMLAAVGGDVETRHGIIVAKSIPTKPYGIVTGEPVVNALKKCPNLLLIPPHHEIYQKYSHALMDIFAKYTDKIEQFSIDEAFLDMTGTSLLFGTPIEAADRLRNEVYDTLGFTVNVGVSSNKLLAKMASDFTKPNKTHTLFPEEIPTKMWPLPVGDLLFVGANTVSKLNTLGIRTIGDLAHYDKEALKRVMKKHGDGMWLWANGIDDSPVVSESHDPKGYSHETTTPYNITDATEALKILQELTERVCKRVREDYVKIESVSVTIKFTNLQKASHQCTLPNATNITNEIYEYVKKLFIEMWDNEPIRLLGVSVTKIADIDSGRQMSLFDNTDYEKLEKLDHALDQINNRFGRGSIKRASSLENNK